MTRLKKICVTLWVGTERRGTWAVFSTLHETVTNLPGAGMPWLNKRHNGMEFFLAVLYLIFRLIYEKGREKMAAEEAARMVDNDKE